MKVTGIIAECNPLHEGHKYLLHEARTITGADYIVVAMSGDYVQRGAPAIVSKEQRAADLLHSGADLVLELPLYVSASGADYFARGGVSLMESLGVVTDLAFGSESGDLSLLADAARALNTDTEAFREALQTGLRKGLPFPQARAAAMTTLELPSSPNDLLGTEYLRALDRTGSAIRPHAIPRTKAASASDLRAQMLEGRKDTDPYLCRDDFSNLLLHALYSARNAEDLSVYLDVSGDLAGRILHELPSYRSFTTFCESVKTRNYTYTRVSRALLHILLGMKQSTMETLDNNAGLCGWIRPIGFRRSAAPLLTQIAAGSNVPFLDKLSRAEALLPADLYAVLCEDLRAEFLYDLMAARRGGQASGQAVQPFRKPLIIL